MQMPLIVAVCRRAAEKQPRESELLCCVVAKEELHGNVQKNVVVMIIDVVQRTGGH